MGEVSACGSRTTHFSREDEESLRNEQTTSDILDKARRDANVGGARVDVRGDDQTWRATKEHQKGIDAFGAAEIFHATIEGVHMVEIHAVEAFTSAGTGAVLGAGLVAGGAVGGLALGVHQVIEAHHKGDEQRTALAKDELHVAMLTHLELPSGYKTEQLAARSQAGQGAQSAASKMATSFATKDKPLVAVMQHHADLGMKAARDFIESGASAESFFAAHVSIAKAYKEDPAFHDGFDALVWAKKQPNAGVYKAEVAAFESRDCRYAQVSVIRP